MRVEMTDRRQPYTYDPRGYLVWLCKGHNGNCQSEEVSLYMIDGEPVRLCGECVQNAA